MTLALQTDSLEGYLAEINRYPLLSAQEEIRVAERYWKTKRLDDAHVLVTSNLRFVVKIAMEFRNYGCRLADLIQEGNIGLMVAVKKFNPLKGFRLITYAAWWIRSYIQDFILRNKNLVKHDAKALKKRLFYRKDNARDAEAAALDFSPELSLNASAANEKTTHLDLLRDACPGPDEVFTEKQERSLAKKTVTTALARLSPKERLVLEKRVLAEEPASLQELGIELGVTRERIRQIESKAMKKLKGALSPEPAL